MIKTEMRELHVMKTVLLIDDDQAMRKMISDVLGHAGHQVMMANDGPSGVALIEAFAPDVVICDINMPDIDGYEVLQEIRENEATSHTRFYFLTGERDAVRGDADGLLQKPLGARDLIDLVERD